MQNSFTINRRTYPRFRITLSSCCSKSDCNHVIEGQTHDISTEGICIIADEELPAGTWLDIYVKIMDNQEEIHKKGIVIWSNKNDAGRYKIGIKLEGGKLNPIPIVLRTVKAKNKY
ncbi:MAG: PilZ domain-containing protein [Candidatus Omnitrophica bacterium]|nr:PilZ domain-containing protein [Candidatus Omnitrophota bacterium]